VSQSGLQAKLLRIWLKNATEMILLRSCDGASWKILIIKPTRRTNFSNSFWHETLHVSDSSSVRHQEFFTVRGTHSNGICHRGLLTACEQDQDGAPSWSCSQTVSKPVWHIPLLCVQWKTPDDGHKNCLKHVKFYSKNKFEKLVHLNCFIIMKF